MNLQRTIGFGLKFLAGALVAGNFFYSNDLTTYKSFADIEAVVIPGQIAPSPGISQFTKDFSTQGNFRRDTGIAEVRALLNSSDCYTCHAEYKILLAPSFSEIAARYKSDTTAVQKLMNKVITGSLGTWGDRPMPAHPELLKEDVQKMIQYIMNLNKRSKI